MLIRVVLVFFAGWIITLKEDVVVWFGMGFSWKDFILIAGGLFLVYKAVTEIHHKLEGAEEEHGSGGKKVAQVTFALGAHSDPAAGHRLLARLGHHRGRHDREPLVIITVVVLSFGIMLFASRFIFTFVNKHPTVKMLALSFLLLIGVFLIAEGFGVHIDKALIYAPMAFAILVEALNLIYAARKAKREQQGAARGAAAPAVPRCRRIGRGRRGPVEGAGCRCGGSVAQAGLGCRRRRGARRSRLIALGSCAVPDSVSPMLDLDFARDLVMTGVIFGAAALVWASWAHERPPKGVGWRIVLVVLQLAGVALMSFGIPVAVRYWETPTAIDPGGSAFVWYIALFWAEIIAIVAFSIYFVRRKKTELIAPLVLTVVGAALRAAGIRVRPADHHGGGDPVDGGRCGCSLHAVAHRRAELLVRHPRGPDPADPRHDRARRRCGRARGLSQGSGTSR